MSESLLRVTTRTTFALDGALARHFQGYRPRIGQQAMAEQIAQTIEQKKYLLAEAGTGTGKTLAYLVPALLAGGRVMLATGTKTLQDQLFLRDLPAVCRALGIAPQIARLKGRQNYLCLWRLAVWSSQGLLAVDEQAHYLTQVQHFAATTRDGDCSDLNLPTEAAIWGQITASTEECLGQTCPQYRDCFVMRARKLAQQADVVIINHHVFFADLALRDDGLGELLPSCQTLILDEAHQLPALATATFAQQLSTYQLYRLAQDCLTANQDLPSPTIAQAAQALLTHHQQWRIWSARQLSGHFSAHTKPNWDELVTRLPSLLAALHTALTPHRERNAVQTQLSQRTEQALHFWSAWFAQSLTQEAGVYSYKIQHGGVQWCWTPLSIAERFSRCLNQVPSAIFTSATLAVGNDFSHFAQQLGLQTALTGQWHSPFDYARQALLYVPTGLPAPSVSDYTTRMIQTSLPLLHAAQGSALFLFTSLKAMQTAYTQLVAENLPFPLWHQGEGSRHQLLAQFRAAGNGILLACQGFWEGVDIAGTALRVVIIDRIPFAVPDDPVLQARLSVINAQGGIPFLQEQIPSAAKMLKQGAGRLIRDEQDHGVLMIADPRLVEKRYGRLLWQSLPPMQRTRDQAIACHFLSERARSGALKEMSD